MTELTLSQKRAIAGAKGGRKTVRRYGKRYMKRLAKWGAHRMHSMYKLEPVLMNDFALVHRETGKAVALLSVGRWTSSTCLRSSPRCRGIQPELARSR